MARGGMQNIKIYWWVCVCVCLYERERESDAIYNAKLYQTIWGWHISLIRTKCSQIIINYFEFGNLTICIMTCIMMGLPFFLLADGMYVFFFSKEWVCIAMPKHGLAHAHSSFNSKNFYFPITLLSKVIFAFIGIPNQWMQCPTFQVF